MSYYCDVCNYTAKNSSNFVHHKKTIKHIKNSNTDDNKTPRVSSCIIPVSFSIISGYKKCSEKCSAKNAVDTYICEICKKTFKYRNNLYRHKKKCINDNIGHNNKSLENKLLEKEYQIKIIEKEKEYLQNLEKEKTQMLNNFMTNANILLNKASDNTKITTQAMQNVSISALKYANDKFKNTPALTPLNDFNINNLNFDDNIEKTQLVEILIYNAKQKSLDKLLGDHIIKNYKKTNPENQSFHTTDCSRLNYIIRELIDDALIWSVDKNGIKICSSIIKPLIKKCISALLEHQKELLQEMMNGNYGKQKTVELIIDIIMSIDSGNLENEINKYIAPFFNLKKN